LEGSTTLAATVAASDIASTMNPRRSLPKSKWVKGANPDTPVSEVARLALTERLRLVAHYLPLAANQATEDVEYIHQLRVCTRRSGAALRLFRDACPPKRAKRIQKTLGRIRRAAGEARDLDVLILRIQEELAPQSDRDLAPLLDMLTGLRSAAQPAVVEAAEQIDTEKLSRRVEKLVGKIRWRGEDEEPALAAAAQTALAPIAADFFAKARSDLGELAELHQLRIIGKQLRYAMELLAGAYPKEFRTRAYAAVERIQSRLGKINDHHVAAERMSQWRDQSESEEIRGALEELARIEDAAAESEADKFRRWWTRGQIDSLEQRLREFVEI